MLADYHVHTEFSNDSIYPMEEVVKDAISLEAVATKSEEKLQKSLDWNYMTEI